MYKLKIALKLFLLLFLIANIFAIFHTYKFTHFNKNSTIKAENIEKISLQHKINTILFGVTIPRPVNTICPNQLHDTIILNSNKKIECWLIKVPKPKGTIIMFHGYGGKKSNMLNNAAIFNTQGYSTFLVDFMGSGGSCGNTTTIGFYEAQEVKTCFDYIKQTGEKQIYLFGTSMGAAAIMKCINDYATKPKGIILECPFGSMYNSVSSRLKTLNAPTFPAASLFVFWGGVQNGFWAFNYKPTNYAKKITCPTLLLYGKQDNKVSYHEINTIFTNLAGKKTMCVYPNAQHENYLIKYQQEWTKDVSKFLSQ